MLYAVKTNMAAATTITSNFMFNKIMSTDSMTDLTFNMHKCTLHRKLTVGCCREFKVFC